MTETVLTQSEADALLAAEKHRADDTGYEYPVLGGALVIPLVSVDRRENFLLDIWQGHIDLQKVKYQNRARTVVVLARLDLGGPPHTNPDGEDIPAPHLHLYREGFGDKWAQALPAEWFPAPGDPWATLQDFWRFCNVTRPPLIQRGLFS